MASKMVIDRQRRERRLRVVLQDLRGKTVRGVAERLGPFVAEGGDVAVAVDWLMGAIDGLLAEDTQDLVAADDHHVRTGIRVKELRRERDEAARKLRRVLVEMREAAAFFFGREAGNALLQVEGPTARAHHRAKLISQVRVVLESLRDPATELPKPRAGVDVSQDQKREWVESLETARTRLLEALERLEAGERESTRAQHQKGARIELHDDELSAIANLQEALLILGRNPEAARSVWRRQRPVGRPARRKKRQRRATKETGRRIRERSQAKSTSRATDSKVSSKEVDSK